MYVDLEGSSEPTLNNGAPLNLTHVDRYLQGPTQDASVSDVSVGELQHSWVQLKRESNSWISGNHIPRQPVSSLVSSAAAVSALGELTPGGALMKGFREDSLGREYYFHCSIFLAVFFFRLTKCPSACSICTQFLNFN